MPGSRNVNAAGNDAMREIERAVFVKSVDSSQTLVLASDSAAVRRWRKRAGHKCRVLRENFLVGPLPESPNVFASCRASFWADLAESLPVWRARYTLLIRNLRESSNCILLPADEFEETITFAVLRFLATNGREAALIGSIPYSTLSGPAEASHRELVNRGLSGIADLQASLYPEYDGSSLFLSAFDRALVEAARRNRGGTASVFLDVSLRRYFSAFGDGVLSVRLRALGELGLIAPELQRTAVSCASLATWSHWGDNPYNSTAGLVVSYGGVLVRLNSADVSRAVVRV